MALIPPVYKPSQFTCKLISKTALTHDVWSFIFEMIEPEALNFEPGQFLNFDIPNQEKRTVRSYSIASFNENAKQFELCIKLVDGPGSHYLAQIQVGDEVKGSGPFGLFVTKDEYSEHILMIATGTGVAPMKSMIEYDILKGLDRKKTLVFGVRHEKDVFYDEIFKGFEEAQDDINYTLTLSRPESDYAGLKGRVTDVIANTEYDLNNLRVFLCGNGAMIKDVSDYFIKLGLPEDKIHHEKFF